MTSPVTDPDPAVADPPPDPSDEDDQYDDELGELDEEPPAASPAHAGPGAVLNALDAIPHPYQRALECAAVIEVYEKVIQQIRDIRRDAVADMIRDGAKKTEVVALTGLSPAYVNQVAKENGLVKPRK